jgi:membrane associated rhomboid family serine protease
LSTIVTEPLIQTPGIVAPSVQHAMDWSLVLVSQGIESEVHPVVEGGRAVLHVPLEEIPRARRILAQYQRENRHRRWQTTVPRVGWAFDLQVLAWGVLVTAFYILSMVDKSPLRPLGVFDTEAVRHGAWWRALTAVWLHSDVRHLTSNLATGLVFLAVAMAEYGAGVALLATLVAGAGANWVGLWLRPFAYHGLGASGVVMAALGLVSVRAFRLEEWRRRPSLTAARGLVSAGFLLVLLGFSPESDVLVHVAGFVLGAVLGVGLRPVGDDRQRQARWDLPAKAIFIVLVSGAWWKALQ